MTIEELLEKLGYLADRNKAPTGKYAYHNLSDERIGEHEGKDEMSQQLLEIINEFKQTHS